MQAQHGRIESLGRTAHCFIPPHRETAVFESLKGARAVCRPGRIRSEQTSCFPFHRIRQKKVCFFDMLVVIVQQDESTQRAPSVTASKAEARTGSALPYPRRPSARFAVGQPDPMWQAHLPLRRRRRSPRLVAHLHGKREKAGPANSAGVG